MLNLSYMPDVVRIERKVIRVQYYIIINYYNYHVFMIAARAAVFLLGE